MCQQRAWEMGTLTQSGECHLQASESGEGPTPGKHQPSQRRLNTDAACRGKMHAVYLEDSPSDGLEHSGQNPHYGFLA